MIRMFLSTPPSRVATVGFPFGAQPIHGFYPRHPRGWRLYRSRAAFDQVQFLSTPPSRVATSRGGIFSVPQFTFLSTPPSRVATILSPQSHTHKGVSIHATLAGGDLFVSSGAVGLDVSIHATLAGGDGFCSSCSRAASCFYPRHPRWWRRHGFARRTNAMEFISTPPSRVATSCRNLILPHRLMFLSTPPSRVATNPAHVPDVLLEQFLSTPPSRVATACKLIIPQ